MNCNPGSYEINHQEAALNKKRPRKSTEEDGHSESTLRILRCNYWSMGRRARRPLGTCKEDWKLTRGVRCMEE
jgi:hypothetical protein